MVAVRRPPGLLAAALLSATLAGGGGCQTAQTIDDDALSALADAPPGSFLQGKPAGLGAPTVINRRDFNYALAFDAPGKTLAFVHHVSTHMELTVTGIEPVAPRFQQQVNSSEFDCDDVVVAGARLLVPSRQGTLRAFSLKDGALLAELATGEPLVRVAVAPGGKIAAVGTSEGRVLVVDAQTLALLGEAVLHPEEVRGLVFVDDQTVASAAQDGTLVTATLTAAAEKDAVARLPTSPLQNGERVFLSHIDGTRAVAAVRDARQPHAVVSLAAVKRLKLPNATDETGAERTLTVMTPDGAQEQPAVVVGSLHLRTLNLGAVVAAVCDGCVPVGAELVLGQGALGGAVVREDLARGELVVRPAPPKDSAESAAAADTPPPAAAAQVVRLTTGALALTEGTRITLPGPATDLQQSPGGLLVSFSAEKAERTFDIHDAERKGRFPPTSQASGAALVDLKAGSLGRLFVGLHQGFTVTGALSPDGRTVVTGGWDRRVIVWDAQTGEVVTERGFGWLVRRVRFTDDGRLLGVAAWTPVNALNEGDSDPALLLYPVAYDEAQVVVGAR
jgi:WD40 repeat protein